MRGILSKRQEPQDGPSYMWRIHKLKERVIGTRPCMDLENAKILTESLLKTEGEPLVLRRHVTEEGNSTLNEVASCDGWNLRML